MILTASSSGSLKNILEVKCSNGHYNFNLLVQSTFNCFAKNYLKQLNSRPTANDPSPKILRKVKKFSSTV